MVSAIGIVILSIITAWFVHYVLFTPLRLSDFFFHLPSGLACQIVGSIVGESYWSFLSLICIAGAGLCLIIFSLVELTAHSLFLLLGGEMLALSGIGMIIVFFRANMVCGTLI